MVDGYLNPHQTHNKKTVGFSLVIIEEINKTRCCVQKAHIPPVA